MCGFACASKHARELVYLILPHHFVSFDIHLSLFFSSVFVLYDVLENGCPLPRTRACINVAYINAAALTSMELH